MITRTTRDLCSKHAGLAVALIATLAMACTGGAPSSEAPRASDEPQEQEFTIDEAALETFIQSKLEEGPIPGLALAVVNADGILFSAGYGRADLEGDVPMTPDTVMNIASISKTFTGTAILQLRDAGLLGLDDDVNDHLPFSVRHPLHPETPITIHQLLTHTSSIDDGEAYDDSYACGDPTVALGAWIEGYLEPEGEYYSAEQNFLASAPGKAQSYSNVGFGLLGYLVEVISGQPFAEFTQESIFGPLGMSESGWYLADIDPTHHATPYAWIEAGDTLDNLLFGERNGELIETEGFVPFCPYSFHNIPDGLVRTSVHQLARFLVAHMRGGEIDGTRLLAEGTVAEALSVQIDPSLIEGDRYDQGLAWRLRHDEAGEFWAHSGADPGARTRMLFSQEDGLGFIIFANRAARVSDIVDYLLDATSG